MSLFLLSISTPKHQQKIQHFSFSIKNIMIFFSTAKIINENTYGTIGRFLILEACELRRDHMFSSDLPLMRFFFISPQQKISSLHTGNETDSEFEVFSKRMTF